MIKTLYIKDFALIENCEIDFTNGLNVVIGETGSGKSMLIDALSIVFGGRASTSIIRKDAQKCIIEIQAEFYNEKIAEILSENDIENNNNFLIIRREISLKSGTRNFINDSPISLNLIKQIADLYIDFHGQHEHQSLLNSSYHQDIFDKAAGLGEILLKYNEKFELLKSTINEYKNLIKKEKSLKEKNELIKFKLNEIHSVNPIENEDEILENELKILENSEKLSNLTLNIFDTLYNDDNSVLNILSQSLISLNQLSEIDSSFEEYKNELQGALVSVKEVANFSNKYNSNIDFNPEKIESIRQRLFQLNSLMKKYGKINDILSLKKELEEDTDLFNNYDAEKEKFEKEINIQKENLLKISFEIESERINFSKIFSQNIIESLSNLGIQNSIFNVHIDRIYSDDNSIDSLSILEDNHQITFTNTGINNIEFFISTNLGEQEKPLAQVASGGEVSRIMLSIKNILADKDNIATLVFDEIDTGVSGRIAQMVGNTMKNLSNYHQIIAISHLPQISAVSQNCILVEKIEKDDKTYSIAKILSNDEKIIEIAKLLSGDNLSDANIKSAYELINNSNLEK